MVDAAAVGVVALPVETVAVVGAGVIVDDHHEVAHAIVLKTIGEGDDGVVTLGCERHVLGHEGEVTVGHVRAGGELIEVGVTYVDVDGIGLSAVGGAGKAYASDDVEGGQLVGAIEDLAVAVFIPAVEGYAAVAAVLGACHLTARRRLGGEGHLYGGGAIGVTEGGKVGDIDGALLQTCEGGGTALNISVFNDDAAVAGFLEGHHGAYGLHAGGLVIAPADGGGGEGGAIQGHIGDGEARGLRGEGTEGQPLDLAVAARTYPSVVAGAVVKTFEHDAVALGGGGQVTRGIGVVEGVVAHLIGGGAVVHVVPVQRGVVVAHVAHARGVGLAAVAGKADVDIVKVGTAGAAVEVELEGNVDLGTVGHGDTVGVGFPLGPGVTGNAGGYGSDLLEGGGVAGVGHHAHLHRAVAGTCIGAVGPEGHLEVGGVVRRHQGRGDEGMHGATIGVHAGTARVGVAGGEVGVVAAGLHLGPAGGEGVAARPALEALGEGQFYLSTEGARLQHGAVEGVVAAERSHAQLIGAAGLKAADGGLGLRGLLVRGAPFPGTQGAVFYCPAALVGAGHPMQRQAVLGNLAKGHQRCGACSTFAVTDEGDVGHRGALAAVGQAVVVACIGVDRVNGVAIAVPVDGVAGGGGVGAPRETAVASRDILHGDNDVGTAVPAIGLAEVDGDPAGAGDVDTAFVDHLGELVDRDIVVGVEQF